MKNKIIITGVAGFIGFSLAKKILSGSKQQKIVGIDNLNSYYDIKLKKDRIKILKKFKNFEFIKIDICNYKKLTKIFSNNKRCLVYHMAAQAGVRYSILKPEQYIRSNLVGFFNVLDLSYKFKIKHLVYASSSSVYGASTKLPFAEKDFCGHPIQLYASTKRSNELMAHSYSALHKLPTSGVRFFTVYGPWGRPDQALYKFTKNILKNKKIEVYNYGNHIRDFTYIDDIVNGIILVGKNIPRPKKTFNQTPDTSKYPFEIYNIGANRKVTLKKYISLIEKFTNKKAKKIYLPLQQGDILKVTSNINKIKKLNYKPSFSVEIGIKKFVEWFKDYYLKN